VLAHLAWQLHPGHIAVNYFRIYTPVVSEGTLTNLSDVDLSDWEPTSVPAKGVLWMIQQPDDYSDYCESMWDLRHREGIMVSRAEREHEKVPPLVFLQGLYDVDTEYAFKRGAGG